MDQLSLMANEAEAYAYGTKNATMWLYRTSGCAKYLIVLYEYHPAGRRSTPRLSSRTSPAGCMRMAIRATTSCRRTFGWWAAGLMPRESLMGHGRHCPKRNGKSLWRPLYAYLHEGIFS